MLETLPNCYAGGGGHAAPPYLIVSKAIKVDENLLSIKCYFFFFYNFFLHTFCCDTYLESYKEDAHRNKKLSVSTEIDFHDSK